MADDRELRPRATHADVGGQTNIHADLDPITAALVAAVQARRHGGADAAVLAAVRQAADYCRTRLQETLERAIAEAQEAQHRFAVAQAGHDEAEKVRRFNEGEAAMRHAEAVELQVRQALLDLVGGIVELTEPALQRLQRAVDATQQLSRSTKLLRVTDLSWTRPGLIDPFI